MTLRASIDQLHTAQKLISLDINVDVDWDLTVPTEADHEALYNLFKKLHLRRFAQFHEDAMSHSEKHAQTQPALPSVNLINITSLSEFQKYWANYDTVKSIFVMSSQPIQADLFQSSVHCIITEEAALMVEIPDCSWSDLFHVMKNWLNNEGNQLIGHDLKLLLDKVDLNQLNCQKIDTMLAYYMLASHQGGRFTLENAIEQYLSYDISTLKPEQIGLLGIQLAAILLDALKENDMLNLYKSLEMPVMCVLQIMQHNGVCVDPEELNAQSRALGDEINTIEDQVFSDVGHTFNLASPKQLQAVLYDQLQMPILQKTPKGQPSTSESALEQLAQNYDIAKYIMRHRSLNKLKNTYTDKLPSMIDPKSKRIHGQFNQAVTSTGRLSSSDPNLQNIPIRTSEGRMIRKAFVAESGHQLICADYSQIELRIMAHFSQDEKLVSAFKNNQDIHLSTAAEVFDTAEPTDEQRRRAKAINFGLIYGMSSFGLSTQIGVSRQEAQTFMDIYFKRYPGVKDFMAETRQLAHEQGYVQTILGRKLQVPGINDRNFNRRQAAERAAINAPMQGSAADIIKKAMIDLIDYGFTGS